MIEDEPLEILYQDTYLVAINKTSELLVYKSHIDKYETCFVLLINTSICWCGNKTFGCDSVL